ncbi:phage baseplate assembly protein V [Hymenobacter weizhouensis]|uniref:phage baseplate assembly protein V n=1 Tax=Hymenobacter sp. YIM 151500-1 TaxID=2987689 RepID=UPI002227D34B|nr:phage baseplate assembly protein V [Hymenobacter sp. YIM 151500-1]UYZ63419.1 phage baseplate assembly protein V [Hymenobacter sp. YIM 151500-1]
MSIHQSVYTHHNFEINIPFDLLENRELGFITNTHRELIGSTIEITALHYLTYTPHKLSFLGIITEFIITSDNDYTGSILIKGQSPTYLLVDSVHKRAFCNQTLADIVNQILELYPINILHRSNNLVDKPLEYVVQYKENNFDFLNRLLHEHHEWFYYDGQRLQIGSPTQESTELLFLDGVWGSYQLMTKVHPPQQKLSYYNPLYHEHWLSFNSVDTKELNVNPLAKATYEVSNKLYGQTSYSQPVLPATSQSSLTQAAQTSDLSRAGAHLTFHGRSGNPNIQIGMLIEVTATGLGSDHSGIISVGKYRVITISHYVDQQHNYENMFVAILHSLSTPPANPTVIPPVAEAELADVIDIKDPLKLGRVRVRYHWPVKKPQHAESVWIRHVTPYSGDGKGILCIPEVGSQVLVVYEHNRAEYPLIMGNLFHVHNKQNATYSPDIKGIQTAGGNKLVFTDTPGEQKILISNGNKEDTSVEINFKGDGSISLKTKGNITLEAGDEGEIKMHAKSISFEAQQKISMKTKKYTMKAENKIRMSSRDTDIV